RRPIVPRVVVCDTYSKLMGAIHELTKPEILGVHIGDPPPYDPNIYVAADIETEGFDRFRHKVLSIGFSRDPRQVYIVPERLVKLTRRLFLEAKKRNVKFIWHNGKFDVSFLRREDVNIPEARVDEDTMLCSYALDETG